MPPETLAVPFHVPNEPPSPRALKRQRSLAAVREDIDHAANGARRVQAALRSANDFDLSDVVDKQVREIEGPVANLIHLHAVDQNQSLVAFSSTDPNHGQTLGTTL